MNPLGDQYPWSVENDSELNPEPWCKGLELVKVKKTEHHMPLQHQKEYVRVYMCSVEILMKTFLLTVSVLLLTC